MQETPETWIGSPGVGNGNSLQYSCLENSMDRRTWQATVHGVTEELGTTEHVYSHSCFYSLFFKTICLYKYVCVCILDTNLHTLPPLQYLFPDPKPGLPAFLGIPTPVPSPLTCSGNCWLTPPSPPPD